MTSAQSLSLSPKFLNLIRYLWRRGVSKDSVFLIVFGRRGTGKTDFSLLLAEILHDLGIIQHFATNVKIYDSHFKFERINNLEDLTLWSETLSGRKMFILDEAGKSMPRRSPMSKMNVEMIKKLQIIRKDKLSLQFVTPDEKFIDSATLGSDLLDGIFLKPNFRNQKILLYVDQLEGFRLNINRIPGTSIKFDTWDSAEFTLKRIIVNPLFSDQDHALLWRWANGETLKEIDVHPEAFRRINRKFLREHLKTHITVHKTKS